MSWEQPTAAVDVSSKRPEERIVGFAISPDSVLANGFKEEELSSSVEDRSMKSSPRVADLLQKSMEDFYRQGPLVAPVACGTSERSQMRDRLAMVCDTKGFDYAIIWKLNAQSRLMYGQTGYLKQPALMGRSEHPEYYYRNSIKLFAFPLGLGAVGRVAASGQNEWCTNVQQLPMSQFHRADIARSAGVSTVVCVAINGVVLEFGCCALRRKDDSVLQYICTVCGAR